MFNLAALKQAQTNLANLLAAQNGGVLSVSVDGQSITYASPQSMIVAIEYWRKQVALLSGSRRRARTIRLDRSF